MEANELRIGNLVDYNGVYFKIYSIRSPEPNADDRFNDKSIITIWNNSLLDVCIDELNPIQLTEKWLVIFGFEELDYAGGCFGKNILQIYLDDFECTYKTIWLGGKYKYVHQLQNIYFELTWEELTLQD